MLRAEIVDIIADEIADHPMWEGIDYTMEREARLADFCDSLARRLDRAFNAYLDEIGA